MPRWRIRGVLFAPIKADLSGPADDDTVKRVVADLPEGELLVFEGQTLRLQFALDAVDQAEAQSIGFETLREAALRHKTIPAMTGVSAFPVSGEVDPMAALTSHLRSAFNRLTRVVGLFQEVQNDLLAADDYFEEAGLDKRNHGEVREEVEALYEWSVEKMKQILTRMAALEAGSQE